MSVPRVGTGSTAGQVFFQTFKTKPVPARTGTVFVVGLTGTFGSGKTTVGRLLKRSGAVLVMDSDRIVDEVFCPNHPILGRIKQLFNIRGRAERKQIAEIVFSDSRRRKQLESIIHPYVFRRIRSEMRRVRKSIVVLEIPLLFETGSDRFCDVTVAVVAEKRQILKRLSKQGVANDQICARIRAQWSQAEKKRRADFFIHNSGSKAELIRNVKLLWRKLKSVLQTDRIKGA